MSRKPQDPEKALYARIQNAGLKKRGRPAGPSQREQRKKPRGIMDPHQPIPLVDRRCLSCGQVFKSESIGNRVCPPCKRSPEFR